MLPGAFPEDLTDHERQFVERIRAIARRYPVRYQRPVWLSRNMARFGHWLFRISRVPR
jgi:hypothetical protein